MTISLPPEAVSTLQEGRQAHVAVASQHGPHVTPELYAWSGDALWFAVASSTLKAKVLQRDPSAGVVVAVPGRSVVLRGDVEILDPRDVRRLARGAADLPRAVSALARFTVRNAPDLLAFVGDVTTGKLGRRLPPMRLLLRLEPSSAALVEGDQLVGAWGGWSATAPAEADDAVPAGGQPAVAALPGPVAVPGRWFEDDRRLHVAAGLRALLDLTGTFPVGVVVDDYTAPGPAAKQGTLLRGTGRLADEPGFIHVDAERVVTWDGVDTASSKVG